MSTTWEVSQHIKTNANSTLAKDCLQFYSVSNLAVIAQIAASLTQHFNKFTLTSAHWYSYYIYTVIFLQPSAKKDTLLWKTWGFHVPVGETEIPESTRTTGPALLTLQLLPAQIHTSPFFQDFPFPYKHCNCNNIYAVIFEISMLTPCLSLILQLSIFSWQLNEC